MHGVDVEQCIDWKHPMIGAFIVVLVLLFMPQSADAQRRSARVDAPKTFRDCPNCPELVPVPAGEFLMGSPETERGRNKDEGPQRRVSVPAFAAGKYEVTFAEYDACVADGGCAYKPGDEGWGRGRKPAINVSWDDAQAYVSWLSRKTGQPYRLLTEAEWEYAARAQTTVAERALPFSTGRTINYRQANYDANFVYPGGQQGEYRQKTTDVGSFQKNAFGLHDMHGNAWEWVEDCYRPTYEGAPTDGAAVQEAACELRILRGGSWNYHPRLLRSAYRYATPGNIRLNSFGFRVARPL